MNKLITPTGLGTEKMASAIDEDTVQTVQSGRATLGAMLRSAQVHLQKVFIVFVIGMIGTIMGLQYGVWDTLRADLLYSQMDLTTQEATSIVAVTPFDVILLQVKIGAVIGILMSLPLLIYFGRDGLRQRGWWPAEHIPTWKGALFVTISLGLFFGGVAYAYELFFPLMFNFLAGDAFKAGFTPQYSIVKWFQFVFLLAVSFGLAAQLPLVMTVLSYTEIIPYETFRDKWRYAVMGIFAFGALFSPPDPFTQIMWPRRCVASTASASRWRSSRCWSGVPVTSSVPAPSPAGTGTRFSAVQCWAAAWCTMSWRRRHFSTFSGSPRCSPPTGSPATSSRRRCSDSPSKARHCFSLPCSVSSVLSSSSTTTS